MASFAQGDELPAGAVVKENGDVRALLRLARLSRLSGVANCF